MAQPTYDPNFPGLSDPPPSYNQSVAKNGPTTGTLIELDTSAVQGQPCVVDGSKQVQPAYMQGYPPQIQQQQYPPQVQQQQYSPQVQQQQYSPQVQQQQYPPQVQQQQYPPQVQQQQQYPQSGIQNPNHGGGRPNANVQATRTQVRQQNTPVNSAANVEIGFTVRQTFSDLSVRRLFIRKVFITLGLQLLVTLGFVCIFYFVNPVRLYVQQQPAVYYSAYGVFLVFYIILICCRTASRKHPVNIIMLVLLTLALSYMVGTIASFHSLRAVVIGLGVTVVVCLSVIIFSIQTKYDFTKCSGLLFMLVMVLFLFGIVTIFTWHEDWYLQVVYGALGALVFSLFLAFDVQLVMGGRRFELDPEEYIFGSLILYIDIIYIFLFILRIAR